MFRNHTPPPCETGNSPSGSPSCTRTSDRQKKSRRRIAASEWRMTTVVFWLLLSLVSGCDRPVCSLPFICTQAEPVVLAEPIDVICVASHDSTCTPENLTAALVATLHAATQRNAHVRLWVSTEKSAALQVADSTTWHPPRRGNDNAKAKLRDAWIDGEAKRLTGFAMAELLGKPGCHQQIADGISTVAQSGKRGTKRDIVVVSSGREVSRFADMDCSIADALKFQSATALGPFPPQSLQGVTVHFASLTRAQPTRLGCVMTPKKSLAQDAAWLQALVTGAGAAAVTFDSGSPQLATPE